MFNFGIRSNQYSKSDTNFMKHLEHSINSVDTFNIVRLPGRFLTTIIYSKISQINWN